MAIRTVEEIMEAVKNRIGDAMDDDSISFVEDISDTLQELSKRDEEDWKKKYEENDASWRQRYRDRFFSGNEETVIETTEKVEPEEAEKTDFKDLFKGDE